MDKKQKKNGVFLMRGKGQTFEQFKTALMQRLEDEGFFEEEDKQPQSKPLKTTGTKTKKVRNTTIRSATEEDYKNRQNWSVGTFHRISTPPEMEQSSGKDEPPDEDQLRIHRLMEADLPRLIAETQHPQNSTSRPKAVDITGVFYSKERLPVVSSKYYGKGSPDDEGQD